jgi:glycolate oxidase FAD binding subunit
VATTLRPSDERELIDAVSWAVSAEVPLELVGSGSKRALGRPFQADHTLDLSAFAGIVAYEPEELVLTAKAATPLSEIEAALVDKGQMLAFEPMDHAALLGTGAGAGTIGGVIACNLSGPRRLKMGAARDHLLGFHAVSGRAERFKSGGTVVKNVTGYDLSKLITGSWGTLAAVTEVSVKVLPAPEKTWTVLIVGCDGPTATRAMSAAMNSPHEVASAAYLPGDVAARSAVSHVSGAGASVTAIRVEGFGPSVEHRAEALKTELEAFGAIAELHTRNSATFWREVRDAALIAEPAGNAIWRLSVPPSVGHAVAARIAETLEIAFIRDWAGGLVWLSAPMATDAQAATIRAVVAEVGGHATLVRAPADIRASVPVFEPQPEALAALGRRIKDSFDPTWVLNPGRMVAGV